MRGEVDGRCPHQQRVEQQLAKSRVKYIAGGVANGPSKISSTVVREWN
jgi:hypothetical protein